MTPQPVAKDEFIDLPAAHRKPFMSLVGDWRLVLGSIVALLGAGGAATAYLNRLATKAEVTQEATSLRLESKAAHERLSVSQGEQEIRIRVVETAAAEQRIDAEWMKGTLYNMAKRQGIDAVPPPQHMRLSKTSPASISPAP